KIALAIFDHVSHFPFVRCNCDKSVTSLRGRPCQNSKKKRLELRKFPARHIHASNTIKHANPRSAPQEFDSRFQYRRPQSLLLATRRSMGEKFPYRTLVTVSRSKQNWNMKRE